MKRFTLTVGLGVGLAIAALLVAAQVASASPKYSSKGPGCGDPWAREEGYCDVEQRMLINRAPAYLLDDLPGIGPVLAERIVQGRSYTIPILNVTVDKPYTDGADLAERVKGIGPKTVAKLERHVSYAP